jgi:hypothetical protein
VSFAMAQLPLPPELPHRSAPLGKRSGSEQAIRPSPALDTMAPPTGAMLSPSFDDLALADGTGMAVREAPVHDRRRRAYAIAGAAVAILVAVVAFAMRGGGEQPAGTPTKVADAGKPRGANAEITVVPIDPAPAQTARPRSDAPDEIEMKPDNLVAPVGSNGPATKPHRPPRGEIRRDPKREPGTGLDKRPEGPTSEAVSNRFATARRQYTGYRDKNGGRLEKDFNDLMTFMQFQFKTADEASRKDAMRRIDTFLAQMRE